MPRTTLKQCAVTRIVSIDPDEPFDLALVRKEHLRAEIWNLVAQEVTPGAKYVVEAWEEEREKSYEYGVRFVRVPDRD